MSLLIKLSWMFGASLLVLGVATYKDDWHEVFWVGGAWLVTLAGAFWVLRRPYAKKLAAAKAATSDG